jgi:hypothetical protein
MVVFRFLIANQDSNAELPQRNIQICAMQRCHAVGGSMPRRQTCDFAAKLLRAPHDTKRATLNG